MAALAWKFVRAGRDPKQIAAMFTKGREGDYEVTVALGGEKSIDSTIQSSSAWSMVLGSNSAPGER